MKKILTNDEINLTCLCCKIQIKNDEDFYNIIGCIFCKRCVDSSFKKHLDAQIFKSSKK